MADNWEDLLESDTVEIKKTEEIKFADEDVEEKAPKPEKKLDEKAEQKNEAPSKETKKKDKKNLNEVKPDLIDPFGVPNPKAGLTKVSYEDKKKGEMISKASDLKNIEDLFGDLKFENKNIDELLLPDEAAHIQFAKVITKVLNRSSVKLHIVEFYKELLSSLYNKFSSKEYQDINTKVTVLFNQKQKEEKPLNTKKKVAKAPSLKATKADQNQIAGDGFDEEDEEGAYVPVKYNNEDDFM